MVNIAVMGYGTVGSGVVEVINTNGARINQRIGDELNIKYVLDLRDFPGDLRRIRLWLQNMARSFCRSRGSRISISCLKPAWAAGFRSSVR